MKNLKKVETIRYTEESHYTSKRGEIRDIELAHYVNVYTDNTSFFSNRSQPFLLDGKTVNPLYEITPHFYNYYPSQELNPNKVGDEVPKNAKTTNVINFNKVLKFHFEKHHVMTDKVISELKENLELSGGVFCKKEGSSFLQIHFTSNVFGAYYWTKRLEFNTSVGIAKMSQFPNPFKVTDSSFLNNRK